jgi:hypothetical protein
MRIASPVSIVPRAVRAVTSRRRSGPGKRDEQERPVTQATDIAAACIDDGNHLLRQDGPRFGDSRITAKPTNKLSNGPGFFCPSGVDGKSGVFTKSVSAHFALLRQIFADAVRDGLLVRRCAFAHQKSSLVSAVRIRAR